MSVQQQGISGIDVLKLLEDLEAIVKEADLPEKTTRKSLNCLQVAKDQAEEKDASKDLIAQNLKKVSEVLETVDQASDKGKSLWLKGQEVFKAIAPWLGTAAKLIGF